MDHRDPSSNAPSPSGGCWQPIDLRRDELTAWEEEPEDEHKGAATSRPKPIVVNPREHDEQELHDLTAVIGELGMDFEVRERTRLERAHDGLMSVRSRWHHRRPTPLVDRNTRRAYCDALKGHDRLTFWSIEYCSVGVGRTPEGDLKDGWLRPADAPFSYSHPSNELCLVGRHAEKALRAWSDGSTQTSRLSTVMIPAERWTPAIYREAVRRWFMRLVGGSPRSLHAMPEIEFENAWYLPDDPAERVEAEELAAVEDEWLAGVSLSARGCRRFESFGRDPSRPLG